MSEGSFFFLYDHNFSNDIEWLVVSVMTFKHIWSVKYSTSYTTSKYTRHAYFSSTCSLFSLLFKIKQNFLYKMCSCLVKMVFFFLFRDEVLEMFEHAYSSYMVSSTSELFFIHFPLKKICQHKLLSCASKLFSDFLLHEALTPHFYFIPFKFTPNF